MVLKRVLLSTWVGPLFLDLGSAFHDLHLIPSSLTDIRGPLHPSWSTQAGLDGNFSDLVWLSLYSPPTNLVTRTAVRFSHRCFQPCNCFRSVNLLALLIDMAHPFTPRGRTTILVGLVRIPSLALTSFRLWSPHMR